MDDLRKQVWLDSMKRRMRSPEDYTRLHPTKHSEKETLEFLTQVKQDEGVEDRLSSYLTNLGANIKYVSLSPFGIAAEFPDGSSYVIDCKSWNCFSDKRSFRDFLVLFRYHILRWITYETNSIKLLMFEVVSPTYLYHRIYNTITVDWLYLKVDDILDKGLVCLSSHNIKISKLDLQLFRRLRGEDL